jgi:DNA mismatch repair protein MutL
LPRRPGTSRRRLCKNGVAQEGALGRIRVLDDSLINRIAAGEVVERPASVVKELIENAIDASASTIAVLLDAGGKSRIRVTDDGCGMDRDDAILALDRHATSKLTRAEDLDAIETLGFRGEALPSIAAVSRFVLCTAARDGEGTEVEVRGGRIVSVRETALPRGTSIEVGALFFNVPARRKFLRAEATELSHVVRLVTRHALARPAVRFGLDHGGRRLLDLPAADSLEERAARILGRDAAARFIPFRLERGGVTAHGLAGRPVDAGPRKDEQHLFVNGRAVQDRTLSHAVAEAYGNTIPHHRHPAVILFVVVDPTAVDVNVHPQKLEVRFARAGEIHDLVRDAVASALGRGQAVPRLAELRPGPAPPRGLAVAEAVGRYLDRHAGEEPDLPAPAPHAAVAPPRDQAAESPSPETDDRAALLERRAMAPLAQFRDSYLIADDGEGIVILDQHAAHERVLFERYLAEAEADRVETQPLLFPVMVDLPPHERLLFEQEVAEFRRLGFDAQAFGGNTVRIDGVPAVAAALDPAGLLRDLIGEASRAPSATAATEPLRRRLVTTAACRAAIKVRRPMSRAEMQELLDALMRCSSPTTCPHGRPVLFRLRLDDVERAFRRR